MEWLSPIVRRFAQGSNQKVQQGFTNLFASKGVELLPSGKEETLPQKSTGEVSVPSVEQNQIDSLIARTMAASHTRVRPRATVGFMKRKGLTGLAASSKFFSPPKRTR